MTSRRQSTLFDLDDGGNLNPVIAPPDGWEPKPAPFFSPERIILAKGSTTSSERAELARQICDTYPNAEIVEEKETPHSLIKIEGSSLLDRHRVGKKTLVLGELNDAVRFSEEKGNTCPNYWHFSPYGFCPYGCRYCYLAGTTGVKFSPTAKIYVNLIQMLRKIETIARQLGRPTAFYLGKLQDGLALDPLTGYSRVMAPFFARSKYARLTLLTKSGNVDNLLGLDHARHTILSWSLSPQPICEEFEMNTPSLEDRLGAMERCVRSGYPVRAVIMPIIPVPGWDEMYADFVKELLERIPLDRIPLGGVCMYQTAYGLMKNKLPPDNVLTENIVTNKNQSSDGRMRYSQEMRATVYSHLIREIRRRQPKLAIGLCLEEDPVREETGIADNKGRCNCVL